MYYIMLTIKEVENMNKQYENPSIEIIEFDSEDILTASGTFGNIGSGDKEIETRLSLYFFMDDKKIHFQVTFHWGYTIRGKAEIPFPLKRLPLVLKGHFERIFIYIKQAYFK